MNDMSKVFAIVLASGKSVRMGKPKLILPWNGLTLIEHILTKLSPFPFGGVKVIVPEQQEALKKIVSTYPYDLICNPSPHFGIGYSLSLAIRSLPPSAQGAIIFLADQPMLHTDDIQKVYDMYKHFHYLKSRCKKIIIQVKYQDGLSGHPILFTSHFFSDLISLASDKGGKDIIQKNKQFLHHCESLNKYPKDIDTPYDYHQLINKDFM